MHNILHYDKKLKMYMNMYLQIDLYDVLLHTLIHLYRSGQTRHVLKSHMTRGSTLTKISPKEMIGEIPYQVIFLYE
jgi:hypothetical protein